MSSGFFRWSKTAADNSGADSSINWAEGQSPSSVNDSARAMMARAAEYRDDVSGLLDTGGSSNAYTLTTNQGLTALIDGFKVTFAASFTNTGAATIAVDSQTAKPLRVETGVALYSGAIVEGSVYTATYFSTAGEWLIHSSTAIASLLPPSIIIPYAGSSAPDGWLFCYGQAVSRTTYAALFTAISTTYGAGDASTTFNIPDLRGRVVAGKDDMGGTSANRLTDQSGGLDGDTLGDTGGEETHTQTLAETPVLGLEVTINDSGHTHGVTNGSGVPNGGGGSAGTQGSGFTTKDISIQTATTGITASIAEVGGGGAHNNVQPTIVLNYIIKF